MAIPTLILAFAGAALQDPTRLTCVAGEVRVHAVPPAAAADAEGALRIASGPTPTEVACPFTFSAEAGSRFETNCGSLRVALAGPCEGVLTREGAGFGLLLTNGATWSVSTDGTPVVVAFGGRTSVRATKAVFEGSFRPGAEVVVANAKGEPVRIYRDGTMVDLLPEGLRTKIAESASAPPPPETAREVRWANRAYAVPPGVHARIDGGRLILDGAVSLQGSAVVVLDRRFVLIRAGGSVEIGPNGEVVATRGAARVLRALGASTQLGGLRGSPAVAADSTGVVLSPVVP